MAYRNGVLEEQVKQTDGPVQLTCSALHGHTENQVTVINAVIAGIDLRMSDLQDAVNGPAPAAAAQAPMAPPAQHLAVPSAETRAMVEKYCKADKKKNAEVCGIFTHLEEDFDKMHAAHAASMEHAPSGGATQTQVNQRLAQASVVALNMMKNDLVTKRAAWENLGKLVAKFQVSHHHLFEHIDDLKSDDLLATVIKDIGTVTTAVGQIQGTGSGSGSGSGSQPAGGNAGGSN
jgi:hypothetical protein